MSFYSTSQSSSSPFDDELAESDKPYHRDHPNTMLSFNRPDPTFPPFYTSTSANTQATKFSSLPRMRTGTSLNIGAAPNTSSFIDDTSSYHSNTSTYPSITSTYHSNASTCPTHYDRYTESRSRHHGVTSLPAWAIPPSDSTMATSPVTRFSSGTSPNISTVPNTFSSAADTSSNPFDMPTYLAYYGDNVESNAHHNEEATSTHTIMDIIARPQNPFEMTYEREFSSCAPVRNTPSYHGAQYHNTVAQPQGGVDTWYLKNSVAGGILPQSYQPVYAQSSSSSHREPSPSPYCDPSSSSYGGPSHSRRDSRRRRGSRAHHSSTTFVCDWLVGGNKPCGFWGPLDAFKTHFRGSHLSGGQNAENVCCWRGCGYRKRDNATIRGMRRDSVWRHVWETHLRMERVIN